MTNGEAINVLENVAVNATGILAGCEVGSSTEYLLIQEIEAIDMAQAALRKIESENKYKILSADVAQDSAKGSHVYIVGERKRPESEIPRLSKERLEAIRESMAKYMNGSHYTMTDVKGKMTGGTLNV